MRDQLSCPNEGQCLRGGSTNRTPKPKEPSKPAPGHLPLAALDSWLGIGHTMPHAYYQKSFLWGLLVFHDDEEILSGNYIRPQHTQPPQQREGAMLERVATMASPKDP